MNTEKNIKEKLDIIVNIPGFNEFLDNAYHYDVITNFQLYYLNDLDSIPDYDL